MESSVYIHAKIIKEYKLWSIGLQDCREGVHLNYYNTCLQLSETEQMIEALVYFREGYFTVVLYCTENFVLDN